MSGSLIPPQSEETLSRLYSQMGPSRPTLGQGLGAAFEQGFESSTFGALGALGREVQGERANPAPLTREEWEGSGLSRPKLQWDERMTQGRAEAMARTFDERQRLARTQQARDPGVLETGLQFGAMMGGSVMDPANLLPLAPAVSLGLRAGAGAAGLTGRALTSAAEAFARPSVGGFVARGVADATLGNLAVAPLVYSVDARYGEDITFGTVMRDLSIGALLGAGFGLAGSALARAADAPTAIRTLDAAASDLAAGRPMEMPSSLATRGIEDAVMRAAPQEMAGVRLGDLPAGVNGAPMTRAEFDLWSASARMPEHTAPLGGVPSPGRVYQVNGEEAALSLSSLKEGMNFVDARSGAGAEAINLQVSVRQPNPDPLLAASRDGQGVLRIDGLFIDDPSHRATAYALRGLGALVREAHADGWRVSTDSVITPDGQRLISRLERMGYDFERAPDAKLDAEGNLTTGSKAPVFKLTGAPERGAAPAAGPPTPETAAASREAMAAESYAWYREALDARRGIERMAAAPVERATGAENARVEAAAQRQETTTLPGPERQHIETMRAEGRLTAADEAILRAGDEQAAELQGVAKGLKEAGECLLRNMA